MTPSAFDFLPPDDRPPAPVEPAVRRKGRPTGLLAMAAVIAFVLLWWLFSGNGPQGPDGNDPVLAVPDVDASADAGSSEGPVPVALSNGLRLTSYVVTDGDRLDLDVAVPRGTCADLLSPRLVESEVSVTVTVTHSTEPDCSPTARDLTDTVSVRLDSPLDGRAVLDGALAQQVRVEPAP
ncbi:hypothetical protein G7072_06540 [Nocardioides sp. HDW12B]|uniref:hypothetical protein n=1 Tax=Nocardioides sp. HDW12B TaxID=2714939 RepID=UPI00140981D7|nr:hypothetical protein [Nocardioides sp. HDW12B]QIK66041.1 hypothetical protein G7072_06540 [Nocardioides sp. HDW12B]